MIFPIFSLPANSVKSDESEVVDNSGCFKAVLVDDRLSTFPWRGHRDQGRAQHAVGDQVPFWQHGRPPCWPSWSAGTTLMAWCWCGSNFVAGGRGDLEHLELRSRASAMPGAAWRARPSSSCRGSAAWIAMAASRAVPDGQQAVGEAFDGELAGLGDFFLGAAADVFALGLGAQVGVRTFRASAGFRVAASPARRSALGRGRQRLDFRMDFRDSACGDPSTRPHMGPVRGFQEGECGECFSAPCGPSGSAYSRAAIPPTAGHNAIPFGGAPAVPVGQAGGGPAWWGGPARWQRPAPARRRRACGGALAARDALGRFLVQRLRHRRRPALALASGHLHDGAHRSAPGAASRGRPRRTSRDGLGGLPVDARRGPCRSPRSRALRVLKKRAAQSHLSRRTPPAEALVSVFIVSGPGVSRSAARRRAAAAGFRRAGRRAGVRSARRWCPASAVSARTPVGPVVQARMYLKVVPTGVRGTLRGPPG